MSYGISTVRRWVILFVVVSAMAGCGNQGNPGQGSTAGHTGRSVAPSETYGTNERDALRIKTDTTRNRVWMLGPDGVSIYDATRSLIRRIILSNWSVAHFICDPDIVLDSSGSAIISSNLPARIWRIDADSFEVTQHEISLQGKEQWDIGFGALAFAADGPLIALTSSANSLWKIDLAHASASMIESYHPPLKSCTLTAQFPPSAGADEVRTWNPTAYR
jgi:hypothetical protein